MRNIKYKEEIASSLIKLANDNNEVAWYNIIIELKDFIVDKYAGQNIARYKGDWKKKIVEVASSAGFTVVEFNKVPWSEIEEELTCKQPLLSGSSTTSRTTSNSSSNKSKNNYRLSEEEKQAVIGKYDLIKEGEKWVLRTGKKVEDTMKKLVITSIFEHPVHSLIMDSDDPVWRKFFTKEELDEIKSYNFKPFTSMPMDTQEYLNTYDREWKSGTSLCQYAEEQGYIPANQFDQRWIRKSMVDVSEVFGDSNKLCLEDFSEADLLHKLWRFAYTAFDDQVIDAKLGERSSVAVSLGRNEERSIENNEKRQRKNVGSKLDILFKMGIVELGSCEVGNSSVTIVDDKFIDDGLMKLPKTLRDMLCMLVDKNPSQFNQLSTIGVLMMGLKMQVYRMDVPCGRSVTRITRTELFDFPGTPDSIGLELIPLLELIWKSKQVMLESLGLLNKRKRKLAQLSSTTNDSSSVLNHSFVRSNDCFS